MDIFDKIENYSHELALKIGKNDSEDDIELYEYSIFMILSYIFTTSAGLFVSIIFGFTMYYVIEHLTFISLRGKAGGYHCDTFKNCFITTNTIHIIACAIGVLTQKASIVMLIISLLTGIIMSPNFPKPSANSPSRGEEEDERFRKAFVRNLIIISIISLIFICLGLGSVSTTISAGILAVCFLSSEIGESMLNSFWKNSEA